MTEIPPPIDPLPWVDDGRTLYVHVLAMKKGDTILIMLPQATEKGKFSYKNILIDLAESDIIEIEKYLQHFHVSKLDALIITHPHDDHATDIDDFYLLNTDKKTKIWLTEYYKEGLAEDYEAFFKLLISEGRIAKVFPQVGDKITTECMEKTATLELIWPSKGYRDDNMRKILDPNEAREGYEWGFVCDDDPYYKLNPNDSSLGITIKYLNHQVFLAGDISEKAWKNFNVDNITDIIKDKNGKIKCDLFKMAHHGSPTGVTVDTVNKVAIQEIPEDENSFAIATEGPSKKSGKYFIPTPTTRNLIEKMGATQIYSILDDHRKENSFIRPISYIFAIVPGKGDESTTTVSRYYSITPTQAKDMKLKYKEKGYYTKDINQEISSENIGEIEYNQFNDRLNNQMRD